MSRADANAEKDRESRVAQAQAASIGRAFEKNDKQAATQ